MSTFFDQQSTYPKPYLVSGINISSNQEYFYLNDKLDNEKKIIEQINELASNFEKINDEIQEVICSHHQLKDTVHQNHKETLFKLKQQARYHQSLSNHIRLSKTDYTFIKTQLDNLNENSQKLRQDMNHLEVGFQHQIDKITNDQQDSIHILSEQISQTKAELGLTVESIGRLTNKTTHILSEEFSSNFETIEEVRQHLANTKQPPVDNEAIKYPIALFLNNLPSNYPAQSIFVKGKQESVTAFLSVNNQEKIALFLDDEIVKKYDYRLIEGITLREEL